MHDKSVENKIGGTFLKLIKKNFNKSCRFHNFSRAILTFFSRIFHFCTPRKRQKNKACLTFSGGIEIEHWAKMVVSNSNTRNMQSIMKYRNKCKMAAWKQLAI